MAHITNIPCQPRGHLTEVSQTERRDLTAAKGTTATKMESAVHTPGPGGHDIRKEVIPLDKPSVRPLLPEEHNDVADAADHAIDKGAHASWMALITSYDTIEKTLSKGSFETELALLMTQIKSEMKELKISQIQQAREQNTEKIAENREQLQEAETKYEEAERARTANKIFGWLSSAVSAIAGAALMATGVGALAGAMMIAGAVSSVASQVVNEMAEAGMIDDDTMKYLGPAMTGIQVAVGIATCAVTFGAGAAGAVAQQGAQIGKTVAQTGLSLTGAALDAGSVVSGTTASVLTQVGNKHIAESQNTQSELTLLQQAMTKLQQELGKVISKNQDVLSELARISQDKEEVTHKVATAKAGR